MTDTVPVAREKVEAMVSQITFGTPPVKDHSGRGNYISPYREFWGKVAEMLTGNPGRWALVVPDCSPHTAGNIRNGKNSRFDPEVYEVTTRHIKNHPERHVSLYMRYIGENGEFADRDEPNA